MKHAWLSLYAYIIAISRIKPWILVATLVCMLFSSLLEGVGLLLLIPLLALFGVANPTGGPPSAINERINELLSTIALEPSLEVVLGGFLVIILARAVMTYLQQVLSAKLVKNVLHQTRVRVYRAISAAKWSHVAGRKISSFAHAITTQSENTAEGVGYLLWLVTSIMSVSIGIGVALMISAKLTLLVLVMGLLLSLPILVFDLRAYKIGKRGWAAMANIFEQITKHISGLKAAKVLSAERQFEADFVQMSEKHSTLMAQVTRNSAQAQFAHTVAGAMVLVGFVYFSLNHASSSSLEPIALIVIFSRLLPRLFHIQSYLRAIFAILTDFEALNRVTTEATKAGEARVTGSPLPKFIEAIRLENVSFSYLPDDDRPVLNHLSLELPAFKSIGIIGASGAGKTTLCDLIAGIMEPSNGRLLIDNTVLNDQNRGQWRQRVAYVLQDEYLFNDTIGANMRIALPDAQEEQIWSMLDLVQISQFIHSLPDGLNTVLGDRGATLSRGQRQKLCLARALLKQPELLILDEATSALNPVDEKDVIDVLESLTNKMSILMIAHRPSSVAWTDQLIVLNEGNLIEQGTLRELMSHEGGFTHAMVAADSRWLKNPT